MSVKAHLKPFHHARHGVQEVEGARLRRHLAEGKEHRGQEEQAPASGTGRVLHVAVAGVEGRRAIVPCERGEQGEEGEQRKPKDLHETPARTRRS